MARQEKVRCHCTKVKRPTCSTCEGTGIKMVDVDILNHDIAAWMIMFSAFQFQTQKLHGRLAHQVKHVFNNFLKQGNRLHDMFMKNSDKDDDSEEYNADHSTFILQVVEKAGRVRHRDQLLIAIDNFIAIEEDSFDTDDPKYSDKLDGVKVVGKIKLE